MDFEKLIGQSTGPRRIEYAWRDVALYALAVGAGEDELIVHRPIDPIKGTLVFEDTITRIYDRGEGKGIVIESSFSKQGAA